jgi:uncharacterized protein
MSEQCSDNSVMDDSNAPSPPDPASPPSRLDATPPAQLRLLHPIFIGPDGLRSGWRLLIYFILYRFFIYIAGLVLSLTSPTGATRLWFYMSGEAASLIAAVVPALLMARLEARPFGHYGLPRSKDFSKLFWAGTLWGLIAITALLMTMHEITVQHAHVFDFGHLAIHGARLIKFALFWGVFFLLVGFYEEFYFRGYALFTLTAGLKFLDSFRAPHAQKRRITDTLNFWIAAVVLSGYFGSVHLDNAGENPTGALAAALIGLFFCLTLRRTGNLWFAVGFHTSFDWGETYLYSVPNSGTTAPGHLLSSSFHGPNWLTGGSVGPEGSVLVFVMIALLWIVFDRLYPKVKYQVFGIELDGESNHARVGMDF